MEKLEVEVKFFLPDVQSMRQNIIDLGARSKGRFFERNLRFDDGNNTLKDKKCLLRLRQDQITTLTFKSTPPEDSHQFKVLNELEVAVSDFDTMGEILESLGFYCDQVYEKWREVLILENTQFCLDAMPYGNFLEIEGSRKDIKQYARRLGMRWDQRIMLTYLELFDIIRKKLGLKFTDITFENFKDINPPLQNYLPLVEAGD